MKKYIKTTAKNAVKKGLVKKGDEIWVKIKFSHLSNHHMYPGSYPLDTPIRIPKPEHKPIDFSEAGRVLKDKECVVMTTGVFHKESKCFSGYLLESLHNLPKGYTSNNWSADIIDWQDITDTYKP